MSVVSALTCVAIEMSAMNLTLIYTSVVKERFIS